MNTDRATPSTRRPSRLSDLNSMLFSGVVHFAALIALGLLSVVSQQEWRGIKLLVSAGHGSQSFDDASFEEVLELDAAVDEAAALGPVQLFSEVAIPTADFSQLDALAESAVDASGFEGLALGGTGADDGTAALASTEFFGVGGYGQSFVYVVDCSDSMNDRGKFDRARYELLQSIEQLASDQRYFVIFFNDGPHPMEGDALVEATEEQVARTGRWVSGLRAHGGTHPLPALLHAISLRPDAVYFLSDGQFDPATVTQLRWRNRANRRLGTHEIPIHTIAFMDRATVGQMRTIARNSGGEHRFVP